MPKRYALVDFDASGDVETVYGEFTVNDATDNPLLDAVEGSAIEMGDQLGTETDPIPNQSHFESLSTERASIAELQQIEIEDGENLADSRSFDTTYQNSNDYAILLTIRIETNTQGDSHRGSIRMGQSSNPGSLDTVDEIRIDDISAYVSSTLKCIVPPDYYFRFEDPVGDQTLEIWTERGFRA